MPQIQPVILTDRAVPPVDHTLSPAGEPQHNGVYEFAEANSVPVGRNRLTMSLRRSGGRYRGEMKISMPVVVNQDTNGVITPVVVRTAYATVQLTFDDRSTKEERESMMGFLASTFAENQALINGVYTDLEQPY